MKRTKSITLLSTATIALCGMLLPAPQAMAAERDTLNAADVSFIKHSAADGMAEVKLAALGVKNAVKPAVKAYAAMIVEDHTKANVNLAKLAATKGVELSHEMEPAQTKTFQTLEKSSDADFDNNFLAKMVSDHEMCVSKFERASKEARDAEVKEFADEMLPTLKAHLKKAKALSLDVAKDKKAEANNTAGDAGDADNTARNVRDRDPKELTPFDQGNSKSDTELTASVRKEIMAAKDLSMNAHNVKIITQSGKVTLRGPVNSAEEKRLIAEIAGRIVKPDQVDCQLEVK